MRAVRTMDIEPSSSAALSGRPIRNSRKSIHQFLPLLTFPCVFLLCAVPFPRLSDRVFNFVVLQTSSSVGSRVGGG